MQKHTVFRRLAPLAALLAPVSTMANQPRYLVVGTGTSYTFLDIVSRVMTYLTSMIGLIALTMFIVGAFMVTLSGVKEDLRERGKDMMIGSVISMAVVAGAYAILRTIDFFLS